jgi:hypothetical protein
MIDETQSILERVFECNVWKQYDAQNRLLVPRFYVQNDRCVESYFTSDFLRPIAYSKRISCLL